MHRQGTSSSTSREDRSAKPQRDWIPPTHTSAQSWSSSIDSELATVGSFDTGTEYSLEDKRSFAVFSSVSCDSPERLSPDTSLQAINVPDFKQVSPGHNFTIPIISTNNSRQPGNFKSSDCQQYNTQDVASKNETDPTSHCSESYSADDLSNNRRSAEPIIAQKTNGIPHLEADNFQVPSTGDDASANDNLAPVSGAADALNLIDSVDEMSSIRTASGGSEKQKYQSFQTVKQRHEPELNNEETKKDRTTKKENNVLSEILNFLDDANSDLPVLRSSHLAINSETESNAEGGFRRPRNEGVKRLHGMSMAELTEEVLGLQVIIMSSYTNRHTM